MTLNRFLKYINILIAFLVLGALGAGYWHFYRPLPKTSGSLTAPIETAAGIVRDEFGVPHITAASEEDALFLQGFVTAQDRMFQMDMARRRASGELAEIIGPGALEMDRLARRMGLGHVAELHVRDLRPQDLAALAAYARGVNHYLEVNRGRLPIEFRLVGYHPRPWRIADSVSIGLQMAGTLSQTWPGEVNKGNHLQAGDPAKVNYLYPLRSGLESTPGSNAWAISGELTASGKPLLANDPHLDFSVPSIWHQVRIDSPSLRVAGAVIVGLPGVMVGHNDRVSWGATNLLFDVQDVYAERLDPRSGRYTHRGQVLQAGQRAETIRVRGQRDESFLVTTTVHGPVVVSQGPAQLALRWTATERGSFHYPFIELGRAANWDEFRAALSEFVGPPQNFVYADVDGNIGYQAAGRLPLRTYDGSIPVDGVSGNFEWQGYIPFAEMPSAYNPESGLIVSANQNPFPEDYAYPVSGEFDPGYRESRIRELLTARTGWEPGEMLAVQTDVFDPVLQRLGRLAVAAFEARGMSSGDLATATGLLKSWDGMMDADEAAPLVASLYYGHLRRAVAESASAGAGQTYDHQMSPAVVERLLEERPEAWFTDYDQLLLRSLVDAIEEGKRMQGTAIESWQWGRYNQLQLSAGVVERIPFIGKRFRFSPIALSGSSNSVRQTTMTLGPSMRMVMDLSDWERSRSILPLGESGHVMSEHYRDQFEKYWAGESNVFPYQQVSGKYRLEIVPE